ncbi:MAG: UDP-N-acetylglucosamine 4,6-dehydratase (inverting) [Hyphomicrobiaceae bacterium]|nr:UDP-N-acetylglucosamine 4,6-dehydratase (inverting) [Hyphomicrobiaceae bacterium]
MSYKTRTYNEPPFDFHGKSILVTGGTGSFGKAFITQLVTKHKPARVVIYSRDELKQFEMGQVLSDQDHPMLRYFIGDVRDAQRLEMAMSGIDYVVHAAALKQVPIAEYNPFECIHTNVIGAENVVRAAIRAGVKKVVALSTDKAANPINLYGASKLASDKIFISANHMSGAKGPRFSVVRYGNVVGSRGSVVPFFKALIDKGVTELPITHADMTRFWITLDQGIDMVTSAFGMMRGGEIYVPKIPSMKVTELARALAPNLPIKIIGIRPGEKLHETMVSADDARNTVELADRYVIQPAFHGWDKDMQALPNSKPVPENFSYSSDNNTEWLGVEDFHEVMKKAGLA